MKSYSHRRKLNKLRKELELDEKQAELDKKINTIMPFANAVLEEEKES